MRISSNYQFSLYQRQLQQYQGDKTRSEIKIAEQKSVLKPSDNPINHALSAQYYSYQTRLNQYQENIDFLDTQFSQQSSTLEEFVNILQSIRQKAIQGANGVYNQDDLSNLAIEVEDQLKELLSLANRLDSSGKSLFGGTQSNDLSYLANEYGKAEGNEAWIQSISYTGNNQLNEYQLGPFNFMNNNNIGSNIFWVDSTQLRGKDDLSFFNLEEDSIIQINGSSIQLEAGFNIADIVSTINTSPVSVKAQVSPEGNLVLESLASDQIWLEDSKGSFFQDIGFIQGEDSPDNLSIELDNRSNSIFDVIIQLRTSLQKGDNEAVNTSINKISQSVNNVSAYQVNLGSKLNNLNLLRLSINKENIQIQEQMNQTTGLDLTDELMNYKSVSFVFESLLAISRNLFQDTLLNFLR